MNYLGMTGLSAMSGMSGIGGAVSPLLSGLQLWYDFEESSGTRYDSKQGTPAHLQDGWSLASTTGKNGNAIENTSDPAYLTYCRVPDRTIGNWSSADSWTIAGWHKMGSYAGGNSFYTVMARYTVNVGGYWLFIVGNAWTFRTYNGATAQALNKTLSPSASAGDWVHFVFGHDAATGKKFLYLNNGTVSESSNTWTAAPDAYLQLGTSVGSDGYGFWNRVLSDTERTSLYNSGSGINGASIGLTLPSAPTVTKKVVCDGNSLTEGNSSIAGVDDYPTRLRDLLGRDWQKVNLGVGGQTTAQMQSSTADVTAAYDGTKSRCVCVCWEITNSIKGGVSAATIQSQLQSYIASRISEGYEVYTMTCLPRATGLFSAGEEVIRQAVNSHMLANESLYGGSGHVIDVASISQLTNANDTVYYADGIHLTPRGYYLIAQAVAAVLGS